MITNKVSNQWVIGEKKWNHHQFYNTARQHVGGDKMCAEMDEVQLIAFRLFDGFYDPMRAVHYEGAMVATRIT